MHMSAQRFKCQDELGSSRVLLDGNTINGAAICLLHAQHLQKYTQLSFAYLKHGCLRTSQFMEWCFACCHFNNSAPQRPDISWFPITPRSLVYNLWGHVLESSYEIKMRKHILLLQKNWSSSSFERTLPVKVSVQGLIPANRLEVPKSEIFNTPL